MREKGQTEVAKTLETPVFSRGIEILTEKLEFHGDITLGDKFDSDSLYAEEDIKWRFFISQTY